MTFMNKYSQILDEIKKEHETKGVVGLNSKILLIDGLNTFIRAFSIDPSCNENGAHIGGISGFLKSIGYAIKLFNPTRCIIIFDGKGGSTRRKKIYPEYKNKRKPSIRYNRAVHMSNKQDEKESMKMQLSRLVQYLECLPVSFIAIENIEADDSISYIATSNIDNTDSEFVIMSADKDFFQLIDDKVKVWSPTKKKLYTSTNLLEEYNISANNYLIYRILDGDKSDNIPGVNGIGLKTLNKQFPMLSENTEVSIDELLEYSKGKKAKIFESLLNSENLMRRNFKLMQLKNVDISGTAKLKITSIFREKVRRMNKTDFQVMALQDQLNAALPNLDFWMDKCFRTLNSFSLSQKE